jgi:hypothetical protein
MNTRESHRRADHRERWPSGGVLAAERFNPEVGASPLLIFERAMLPSPGHPAGLGRVLADIDRVTTTSILGLCRGGHRPFAVEAGPLAAS